jgi:hypothetical protein
MFDVILRCENISCTLVVQRRLWCVCSFSAIHFTVTAYIVYFLCSCICRVSGRVHEAVNIISIVKYFMCVGGPHVLEYFRLIIVNVSMSPYRCIDEPIISAIHFTVASFMRLEIRDKNAYFRFMW